MNRILLAAVLAAVFPAAHAQGFVGASAGATQVNLDCAGTIACDNTASGGKVFGGYRWANGLGVEGMVMTWGKGTATVRFGFTNVDASVRSSGAGAGVSYWLPIGDTWSATFRLGLAANKSKADARGGGVSAALEESSAQPYSGLQFSWHPTKAMSLDIAADFSRFELEGDAYNTRMVGVGVTFRF